MRKDPTMMLTLHCQSYPKPSSKAPVDITIECTVHLGMEMLCDIPGTERNTELTCKTACDPLIKLELMMVGDYWNFGPKLSQ